MKRTTTLARSTGFAGLGLDDDIELGHGAAAQGRDGSEEQRGEQKEHGEEVADYAYFDYKARGVVEWRM